MGSDTLWAAFREIVDSHRKMSNRSVCSIAALIQKSENVCIPDVSANSVLVLWYLAILRQGRQKMS